MASEEDLARWKIEFLEDDTAIALLRERILELGFGIDLEAVERKPFENGDTTAIRLKLTRIRRSDGNTLPKARSDVKDHLDLMEALKELSKITW